MNTHTQVFLNKRTTTRATLAGVFRINQDDTPTGAFSLVRCALNQLTPSHIGNAFIELVAKDLGFVRHHCFDRQILKANDGKIIDQLARSFMCKIGSFVADSFVNAPDNLLGFFAFDGSLCRFSEFALCFRHCFLIFAEEAGICDLIAVAQSSERLQTNINAYGFLIGWQGKLRAFTSESNKPLVTRSTAKTDGFRCSAQCPMELYLDRSDLAQIKFVASQCYAVAILRIAHRIVPAAAFKAGIAWVFARFHTTEESFVSQVNPNLHILQNLRMHFFQRWFFFLPQRQHRRGIVIPKRCLALCPGVFSGCQGFIVDKATKLKLGFQLRDLRFAWVNSILICFKHISIVEHFCLKCNCEIEGMTQSGDHSFNPVNRAKAPACYCKPHSVSPLYPKGKPLGI
ncbi:MAG: hypothetical protein U0350_42765 [Caldilineaceae bacterium]